MSDDLKINIGDYFNYSVLFITKPYKLSCCMYCLNTIFIVTNMDPNFDYFTGACYICRERYSFSNNTFRVKPCKKIAYIKI